MQVKDGQSNLPISTSHNDTIVWKKQAHKEVIQHQMYPKQRK